MPIHFSREVFYFHFYILLFSHDTFTQLICLLNASVGTFMLFLDKLPQPAVGGIISRTHVHVHEAQTCNPLLKSLPYSAAPPLINIFVFRSLEVTQQDFFSIKEQSVCIILLCPSKCDTNGIDCQAEQKAPYLCRAVLSAWSLLWSVNVNMSYCASANCHFYYLSECMGHCSGKWLLHDQSHKKEMLLCKRVLIE